MPFLHPVNGAWSSVQVRQLSEPQANKMIMPSAGVHVTLPDYYSPEHLGMIVPKTKDGRVVFMLPWEDATIAGTTGALSTKCSDRGGTQVLVGLAVGAGVRSRCKSCVSVGSSSEVCSRCNNVSGFCCETSGTAASRHGRIDV
jgi:hypothetical protein